MNSTTRHTGILCGWSGRLEQSSTGHSIRSAPTLSTLKKHSQGIVSHVLTSITDCLAEYAAANIVRRTRNVTAPYKLLFYYCSSYYNYIHCQ